MHTANKSRLNISAREIDTLAGIVKGTGPLPRTDTKATSAARFVKALNERRGKLATEEEVRPVLEAESFLVAHHALSALLGEEFSPQPEVSEMDEEVDIVIERAQAGGVEPVATEPTSASTVIQTDPTGTVSPTPSKAPMRFKGTEKLQAVNGNPRRPSSHGFRSLQLIVDNPGITVSAFREKGGRLNDLRWDIAKGNVAVG